MIRSTSTVRALPMRLFTSIGGAERAATVHAFVRRHAAVAVRGALLELLRAARRLVRAHELARAVVTAIASAALFAGGAGAPVRVARIDGPEAAHVAGAQLLPRQIKRRVARIVVGRR